MGRAIGVFSLDVLQLPDGRVELTRKFVDGMGALKKGWPGEVVAMMAPRTRPDTNLDQQPYALSELPFSLVVKDPREAGVAEVVRGASVVLIGVDYRHGPVARVCRALGVPYVVIAEYNYKTRVQIAVAEEPRVRKLAKRVVWETMQERKVRALVAGAAGLQCNGTPTFEAWAHLNRDPILYFDTRVTPPMLASPADVERRGRGDVLHLAFSGRLIPMKGVLHLVEVARHLRSLGVRFVMHVWGGGPQEQALSDRIAAAGLEEQVRLEGVVPFEALMAKVREGIDVFVCPHIQGDPSCTYLETLSCGVPIVGFDNDAWRGLRRRCEVGWGVPLGDTRAMAEIIARLDRSRDEIRAHAARAVRFASGHTFDATFARRVEHLRRAARL